MVKNIVRAIRLLFIPAVWLASIPGAVAAGRNPGLILPKDVGPYPVWHVVTVILLMAVESAGLFVVLSPTSYSLTDWQRALKACGLLLLAILFEPMFMVTDMPGYVYINGGFLFTWFMILGVLVVVGIVASRMRPDRVTDSEADAA